MDLLEGLALGLRRLGLRLGWRELAAGLVHPPMDVAAFHRILRVVPFALHPHQIGEPRAVAVLVDHARGQQRHIARQLREGQGQIELLGLIGRRFVFAIHIGVLGRERWVPRVLFHRLPYAGFRSAHVPAVAMRQGEHLRCGLRRAFRL